MSAEPKQGWWYRASEEQRLRQIDGGIECGMSSRQIAMVSGVDMDKHPVSALSAFAIKNGRSLAARQYRGIHPGVKRVAHIKRDHAAYMRGDAVNLWGDGVPQDEFALDEVAQ